MLCPRPGKATSGDDPGVVSMGMIEAELRKQHIVVKPKHAIPPSAPARMSSSKNLLAGGAAEPARDAVVEEESAAALAAAGAAFGGGRAKPSLWRGTTMKKMQEHIHEESLIRSLFAGDLP